jgi:hypothetical protein
MPRFRVQDSKIKMFEKVFGVYDFKIWGAGFTAESLYICKFCSRPFFDVSP